MPVYSYLNKNTVLDDITPGGCNYTYTYNNDHWNKEGTYTTYASTILSILQEPVGRAFNLTPDSWSLMTFVKLYDYSDVLLAENMQGDPPRYNFTQEEWHYIRQVQKIVLLSPFSDYARDLWITKQFKKPLEAMR